MATANPVDRYHPDTGMILELTLRMPFGDDVSVRYLISAEAIMQMRSPTEMGWALEDIGCKLATALSAEVIKRG